MPSKRLLAAFVVPFSIILGSLVIATPLFAASEVNCPLATPLAIRSFWFHLRC
jgi:hypothetical protein